MCIYSTLKLGLFCSTCNEVVWFYYYHASNNDDDYYYFWYASLPLLVLLVVMSFLQIGNCILMFRPYTTGSFAVI